MDDDGFTLIEVLITLMITGLTVAAIIAGLGIASAGSGVTREVADASALLTSSAEQIEAATYQPCPLDLGTAYQGALAAAAPPLGGGPVAAIPTITNMSIWDGAGFVPATGEACTFDGSSGVASGDRMQRITLRLADDSLTFVKRAQ